ncbi:uncharacterized protein LOC115624164 [Scaptodrosophila lebanonensis]|uniref:Uncharacterized protein LOC115624164 n=1 Tax=Drosophila lebanonensis TaxID=7225 RepID=A0A6J2THX9_DROLE|nr:uncharacterized protein LOC115624164 [Scaptodrosophila lebanonensis]
MSKLLTACPDELPNPHKGCIREMLDTLICNDNDVKRLNTELRNIQLELKAELAKKEVKCGDEKNRLVCESMEDLTAFAQKIASVDEIKHHYTKMCEDIRKRRDNIILYARQCMQAYNEEKCKFKSFHENTIDYIKRTATLSQDRAVIANCERDICEMHKRFVKEVGNIKRCENELNPFFQLLKQSDPNTYCECCCFKEYDWLPQGKKMDAVGNMGDELKEQMGQVLVRAFAQLHMHMPQDPRSFIASYLMNLDRNEQEMKEKLDIFQKPGKNDPEFKDPTFRCEGNCVRE